MVKDGVRMYGYTDIKSGTVIEVSKSGKVIKVQRDKANLLNGANSGEVDALVMTVGGFSAHTSGVQRWDIQPDKTGSVSTWSLRKSGYWVQKGSPDNRHTRNLAGGRYEYYDFNF